jgi:carbamoyltransferase
VNTLGISGLHNSISFKKQMLPRLTARQYRIAQGLDSAAVLVADDGIRAAAAEERFTGEKGTGAFPVHAIEYCLRSAGLALEDVDFIAHGFSYESFRQLYAHSEYTKRQFDQVFSREAMLRCLEEHLSSGTWGDKLIEVPHHLAHAASAFYPSGFPEALILVADGMGEMHSMTIAVGQGNDITIVKQVPALDSLGILYGVFTLYLGFWMNFDEYKVMGLAPYGDARRYFGQLMQLVHLKNDGGLAIPILHENHSLEEKETYGGTLRLLAERFGPQREPEAEIKACHRDIAAALQAVLQKSLMHVLRHHKRETGLRNLCMAGGVALNCTANGVVKRSRMFQQVFVQPAAGDDGTALGAALYVHHQRCSDSHTSRMGLPLWGPEYDQETCRIAIIEHPDCAASFFASFDDLVAEVVRRLVAGQVVAWFQGRMEFGPRALGSRSILANPRDPGMRDRINNIVKKREGFRPFAPAVTSEQASRFFEIDEGDEATYTCMLFVASVRPEYRELMPAITHVDNSARLQVVFREENAHFWQVLDTFGKATGVAVLLNTSFNVRGQPIICTPSQAVQTFLSTELDALAIGNFLVTHGDR